MQHHISFVGDTRPDRVIQAKVVQAKISSNDFQPPACDPLVRPNAPVSGTFLETCQALFHSLSAHKTDHLLDPFHAREQVMQHKRAKETCRASKEHRNWARIEASRQRGVGTLAVCPAARDSPLRIPRPPFSCQPDPRLLPTWRQGFLYANPRSPFRSASTASTRPAMVGCSKISPSGASTTKTLRISKMRRVARIEWPPRSKKLSSAGIG